MYDLFTVQAFQRTAYFVRLSKKSLLHYMQCSPEAPVVDVFAGYGT